MKKLLLIASALMGFVGVAQAQETTVKTTTVQYQVPSCTNCRTTTQTRTVYPTVEAEPTCTTCAQPVVAQPVLVKEQHREYEVPCRKNQELGIRNPIFAPKQGQVFITGFGGIYQAPRQSKNNTDYTQQGWMNRGRVSYGLMDRWTIALWGGKEYFVPKKKQYKRFLTKRYMDEYGYSYEVASAVAAADPTPHFSKYDINLSTEVHVLDLCHLDAFVGVQGQWHRHKTKAGDDIERINGVSWGPTAKIGVNIGWFTPYIIAGYTWDHTKDYDAARQKKSWGREHGYTFQPGIYIQPSKWYAFNFDMIKVENSVFKPEFQAGFDFYPYKNVAFNMVLSAHRPLHDPAQQFGLQLGGSLLF